MAPPPPPPAPPPRWELRFDNFRKAARQLEEDAAEYRSRPFSKLEQAGMIQHFELIWELGWKLLGDYLVAHGAPVETPTPHNIIRAAFRMNLISDGDGWMAAMRLRNALSHEYDEDRACAALQHIAGSHLALFQALDEKLANEI